jgi:hypothetical protein
MTKVTGRLIPLNSSASLIQNQRRNPTGEQSSPAHAALIELLREQVRDAKQREQELREEKNRLLAMLEGRTADPAAILKSAC